MLVGAALIAGVAGTWSPCGMSMIETISIADRDRRRRQAGLAVAALTAGCVAGGVLLFCGLAIAGELLWNGGRGPALVAALVATAAAALDVCGVRVLPQIRHQVPEPWRRRMPLSLASAAYGVLLGLGITTFVMSYTLWAAAILSLLVASPAAGVVVGAAFGLGRALPIALLAPWADRDWAVAVQDRMMQHPATLRIVRALAAVMMGACAVGIATSPALASGSARGKPQARVVAHGIDPSVDGDRLAFRKTSAGAFAIRLRTLGSDAATAIAGDRFAIGDGVHAKIEGQRLTLLRGDDGQPVRSFTVPAGTSGLAVSDRWVAYTVPAESVAGAGFDRLFVRRTDGSDEPRSVLSVAAPQQIGRPALSHDRLAYHVASVHRSRIEVVNLVSGQRHSITRSESQVLSPSLSGEDVAFIQVTSCRQRLIVQRLDDGADRVLAARYTPVLRDTGFGSGAQPVSRTPHPCHGPERKPAGRAAFWQTALSAHAAFLTIIDASDPRSGARIVEIAR